MPNGNAAAESPAADVRILDARVRVRVYDRNGRTFDLLDLEPGQRLIVEDSSYARDADDGTEFVVDDGPAEDGPGYWPEDLLYTEAEWAEVCAPSAVAS